MDFPPCFNLFLCSHSLHWKVALWDLFYLQHFIYLTMGNPLYPDQPPAANATAGAWSVHNNAMTLWQRESTAIASLIMETILQSLDRVSSAWFFKLLRNRYNRNPQNFFLIMNREYDVPDTTTISAWIRQLQVNHERQIKCAGCCI